MDLIGFMYLIGVIGSLLIVPMLADMCGRKIPFVFTILISVFS